MVTDPSPYAANIKALLWQRFNVIAPFAHTPRPRATGRRGAGDLKGPRARSHGPSSRPFKSPPVPRAVWARQRRWAGWGWLTLSIPAPPPQGHALSWGPESGSHTGKCLMLFSPLGSGSHTAICSPPRVQKGHQHLWELVCLTLVCSLQCGCQSPKFKQRLDKS